MPLPPETVKRLVAVSAATGDLTAWIVETIVDPDTPESVLIAMSEAMSANLRMVKAIGVYVQDGQAVPQGEE